MNTVANTYIPMYAAHPNHHFSDIAKPLTQIAGAESDLTACYTYLNRETTSLEGGRNFWR